MAARNNSCLPFFLPSLLVFLLVLVFTLASAVPQARASGETAGDGIGSPAIPGVPKAGPQQPALVQRVEFVGNRRIRSETLKAKIFTREGDAYSEDTLRRDFQALWNTQFFEDIRLEVEDSPDHPNAKIITFYVKERPVIRRIEYKGIKSVTKSEILD